MSRDRYIHRARSIVAATAAVVLVLPGGIRPAAAQTDGGDPPARVGRIAVIDHGLSMHRADETQWSPALVNYPVTSGLSLWADQGSRAEIGIGSAALRMGAQTEVDVDRLDDRTAEIRLPQGSMNLSAPLLAPGESIDVETPRGRLHIDHPGIYRFDAGTTEEPTRVVVFQGDATIAGPTSSLDVHAGEPGLVAGTDPLSYSVDRAAVATSLDTWAQQRGQIWHRNANSSVATGMTGYEDLDAYGSWGTDAGVGAVWYPRQVPAGWEPYRDGRWEWVDPWGWTWIDDQPWGFAPSHYGRWVRLSDRWAWTPGPVADVPVYAPAMVTFVGAALIAGAVIASEPVGWVPLGPRDVYYPRYRASAAYARRINITNINQTNIRNIQIDRIDFAHPASAGGANGAQTGLDPATLQNRRFAVFAAPAVFGSGRPVTPVATPAALAPALAAAPRPGAAPARAPGTPPISPLLQPANLPGRRIAAPAVAAGGPPVPAVGVAQTRFIRPLAAPGRAIPAQAVVPAAAPQAVIPAARAPAAPAVIAPTPVVPAPVGAEPALRPIEPDRRRQPEPPAVAPPAAPAVRPESAPVPPVPQSAPVPARPQTERPEAIRPPGPAAVAPEAHRVVPEPAAPAAPPLAVRPVAPPRPGAPAAAPSARIAPPASRAVPPAVASPVPRAAAVPPPAIHHPPPAPPPRPAPAPRPAVPAPHPPAPPAAAHPAPPGHPDEKQEPRP